MINELMRRRAMMFEKAGDLPSGYTQYDWVQSDLSMATPKIDTQLSMEFPYQTYQKRYRVEGMFANCGDVPSTWDRYVILSTSITNNEGGLGLQRGQNSPRQVQFYYNNNVFQRTKVPATISYGEWHSFILTHKDVDEYGGIIIFDNVSTPSTDQTGNNATTRNLMILGIDNSYAYPCRLARLKVFEYDVLIADFVPAQRNSDGVVGFYDVVRDIFCPPSGEGVTLLCGYGFANFNT